MSVRARLLTQVSQPEDLAPLNYGAARLQGLVAAPNFNRGIAGLVDDASSRLWTNSGATRVIGSIGPAANFVAASSQYIRSQEGVPNPKNGMTVLMLVNPTSSTPGANRGFIGFGTSTDTISTLFAYQVPSTGHLGLFFRDSASTTASIASTQQMAAGRWHAVAVFTNGTNLHGVRIAKTSYTNTTSLTAPYTAPVSMCVGGVFRDTISNPFDGQLSLPLVFNRVLSDAEIDEWAADPWQVFEPLRIWVPVSAGGGGGDVSLALTGQGGSFSQGVFTLQRETPVAGQSATFSAGLLGASLTIPLTGVSGAFAQGSVVPSVAVALIGLSATAAQGSPAASIILTLTGQAGTFATGTVTASTGDGATLVGQGGTFSQGTPGVSITVALTGITATLATGIVSGASGSATITLKAGSWLRYKKLI